MKTFYQHLKQPWKNTLNSYSDALAKVEQQKGAFTEILHIVTPYDGKYLVDIKSQLSYEAKLKRKPANGVHDLLRGAVLTTNKQEMVDVVAHIKQLTTVVECEYKREPSYDGSYCGAIHMKIKVGDIIAEIQIMTSVVWQAKESLHNYYELSRKGQELDKSVKNYSRFVYDTANKSSL